MLLHPTLATLQTLRLSGMYHALEEQLRVPEFQTLSFEERLVQVPGKRCPLRCQG